MSRAVWLLVVACVAACGGDMSASDAWAILAPAQCERLERCNPGQLAAMYGTVEACEEKKRPTGLEAFEDAHCSRARVEACAAALAERCDHVAACEGC